jgi:F420-dependent oxidoreductase-like protein
VKLGLLLGHWAPAPPAHDWIALVVAAERLGYQSVWSSESWGSDAFTPLAVLATRTSRIQLGTAVAQLPARTPTATAMHAMTLDHLSGGRFVLGLGASGPQVSEGWYGAPFRRPLARTAEYVAVVRQVLARQLVRVEGPEYPLPYSGPDATGLGKPLRTALRPLRRDLPIFLGAEGPRNVALATRIADGWLPLYYVPERPQAYPPTPPNFEIAASVPYAPTPDGDADALAAAYQRIKAQLAFYVGGMGARAANFHADLIRRLGHPDTADQVQRLYLSGDRAAAAAAVPDALVDEIALLGPPSRIADRLAVWSSSPVTSLLVSSNSVDDLRLLADLVGAAG